MVAAASAGHLQYQYQSSPYFSLNTPPLHTHMSLTFCFHDICVFTCPFLIIIFSNSTSSLAHFLPLSLAILHLHLRLSYHYPKQFLHLQFISTFTSTNQDRFRVFRALELRGVTLWQICSGTENKGCLFFAARDRVKYLTLPAALDQNVGHGTMRRLEGL